MNDKSTTNSICIIGGSGFYNFLSKPSKIKVKTKFGSVVLYHQNDNEKDMYFLPRHGNEHSIPPHMVNYKANILALHLLNISRVIATNAVGSLNHSIKPGDYIILDQFIDFVRPLTFFDGDFRIKFSNGKILSGVVHIDESEPYCPQLREILSKVLGDVNNMHVTGTYATTIGPRFETPAEIKALQCIGADVVGMTNSSEAILCRELGICYGTIAVVTNMAAGFQKNVNQEEVMKIFDSRLSELKELIQKSISIIPSFQSCSCSSHIR